MDDSGVVRSTPERLEQWKQVYRDGQKEIERKYTEYVEAEKRRIKEARENGNFRVVWTLIKGRNTGQLGLPELLKNIIDQDSSQCPLQGQEMSKETLERYFKDDYVEHPTTMLQLMGLNVKCFAKPYSFDKEHKGKDNVAATFLTVDKDSGLARNTIIGRAVFVRYDEDNNPVGLSTIEMQQALAYINDLMSVFSDCKGSPGFPANLQKIIPETFPYYDMCNKGHLMSLEGFSGCSFEGDEEADFCYGDRRSPGLTIRPTFNIL